MSPSERNMLRNTPQPLHNDRNATALHRGVSVALSTWRPLSRPPRRLWVPCVECRYSTINEDRALRGWRETTTTPRRYLCAVCARDEATA
jgi:hypothetical protein